MPTTALVLNKNPNAILPLEHNIPRQDIIIAVEHMMANVVIS
jgi:hypothetical protein